MPLLRSSLPCCTMRLQRFRSYGAELNCLTIKEVKILIIKKINLTHLNGKNLRSQRSQRETITRVNPCLFVD